MTGTRAERAARGVEAQQGDQPIAVIAGAGKLPEAIAQTLKTHGRDVFVVAVDGEADRGFDGFPTRRLPMGAAGRLLQSLRENNCTDIIMAGQFRRPRFSEIEFDFGTLKLALSSLLSLRFGGDDQVVSRIVRLFEAEGFRIVGPREVVPDMISTKGPFGRHRPSGDALADIEIGAAAIRHLGSLDIGQSLAVHDRRIIAVEAAEGTDAMIRRCEELRANGRLNAPVPSGVLVKMTKPGQETRLEMPVIGPETVDAAIQAGLSGLAVEAGGVIVVDRNRVAELGDKAGLFVYGF